MEAVLRAWVWVAVGLSCVQCYLMVNKIWIRKHEQVVADSVSLSAQLVAISIAIPFMAMFWLDNAYQSLIVYGVFMVMYSAMIAIGSGLWVEGHRTEGLLTNLRRALRLERSEASSLFTNLLRPVGARRVLRILYGLAVIDREFEQREKVLIEGFAERWNVDMQEIIGSDDAPTFAQLHDQVVEYLRVSPPVDQAGQLVDLLALVMNADEKITAEEELIVTELRGLLGDYAQHDNSSSFRVMVAPQSPAQEVALLRLLPDAEKIHQHGGEVFEVGHYYSKPYTELVCKEYQQLGYLTFQATAGRTNDDDG